MKKTSSSIGAIVIGGMGLASFTIGMTTTNIPLKIFLMMYCVITIGKPVYDHWFEKLNK